MRIIKENKCRDCGGRVFIWIVTDTGKERLCCDECGAVHDFKTSLS